ncbi:MAG: ComEC/Rec2 family competence protein [Candidatus Doudnabacteria bacterium]|nr:ComEC/Rec2 family competence protein [Candidatus Doudnabacteria bacterium]
MSKSKIFIGLCLSFGLGIFLASRFSLDWLYIYFLFGVAVIIVFGSLLVDNPARSAVRLSGVFLFFICLGGLRFQQAVQLNSYENFFGQKVQWEGHVMEDPDIRADRQLLTIRPEGFDQRILVTSTKSQEFFYGDRVVFEGKPKEPHDFNDFDYSGYLERFGVYAAMQYPKIYILKNNQGNKLKFLLLKTKQAFSRRMQKFLPEPENSLALGILIGARRGLPPEVMESFNITGTSHIVAISGFNIAVIVAVLNFSAWIVGRRASFWLSLCMILGFVVTAGGSASVVRAGVMGILLLMAFNIGRMYSVMPALLFAAGVMLFANPKILFWDVGFQMSFAATLGLVLFMPILESLTSKWPKVFGLKSIFLATLSATISTLPLALWHFGRLSLVALLANLLILPVVPLAMLFGFLTIIPILAPGFAFISGLLLTYILWVVNSLAKWPLASLQVKISEWVLLASFASLTLVYWAVKRWSKRKLKLEQVQNLW